MSPDAATSLAPPRIAKTARDENFPVASRLIGRSLRPTVMAFYRFARSADDIADSPDLPAAEKVARLRRLDAVLAGDLAADSRSAAEREAAALRDDMNERGMALDHPRRLLQAFQADAVNRPCPTWSDLLAYCRYSAAPVGRFLLDLHGESRAAWPAADALCAALQILNHLQDCGEDYRALRRVYIPTEWLAEPDDLAANRASPALRAALDRALDGVERLNETARPLASGIANRRLRMEAATILTIAQKLSARLRRGDPLAGRVELSAWGKLMALIVGVARGLRA